MKFLQKVSLWRGLFVLLAFIFVIGISAGQVANANAGAINNFLGIQLGSSTNMNGKIYYESRYGELNDENCEKLVADATEFAEDELSEGSVLLWNDGTLPFAGDVKKVSLFGRASADIVYRSVCGGPTIDENREVNLKKAFNDAGFEVNDTLFNAYAASPLQRVKNVDPAKEDIGEESAAFYTSEIQSSFAAYADAAVVVLSREGGEGSDVSRSDIDGLPRLRLHDSEKEMLSLVQRSGFKNIVVLLNSVYPMEVEEIKDYGVGACLWIGNPGFYGLPGVVEILQGEANPSGHLPDTYAENSLSAPSMQNFGEYKYTNAGELGYDGFSANYVVYQEGIYVGYKYYETRYADSIEGNGNADGSAGCYASPASGWDYAAEVSYPFGYGLSYTQFEQQLTSLSYDEASDTFSATVKVKNIGEVEGKDAVQLYAQVPYTDYDRQHLVEKPAIQLVDYCKTDLLAPGEEKEYELTFERYLLASYDANEQKGYILDDGDYLFSVGDDAHDALNNILAYKGYGGLVDHEGNPVEGDEENVLAYTQEAFDAESYRNSPYTGAEVTNLFDDVDVNNMVGEADKITYLTRQDWQGTYPAPVAVEANEKIQKALDFNTYTLSNSVKDLSEVTYGEDKGIKLYDMAQAPYDDPRWDEFIEQMSLTDLATAVVENYGGPAIESIMKPYTRNVEGPEGLNSTYLYGSKGRTTGYACMPILAATFDKDMQHEYGVLLGEEALFSGVNSMNGVGANIHRSPYGGRAAEYFSEDGVLSYYAAGNFMKGVREKGLIANIKHFALNEQEYSRQGISTFVNEQAIREIYTRAYEGAFTFGNAISTMTSYNRWGCTYVACYDAVNRKLLRGEWGFQGQIITDYMGECEYCNSYQPLIGGTTLYGGSDRSTSIAQLVSRNKDGYFMEVIKEAAHHQLYTAANSTLINGLSAESQVGNAVAWWQVTILVLQVLLGVLAGAALVLYVAGRYVVPAVKKRREVNNNV